MTMANVYKDPYPEHGDCPFCGRKRLNVEKPYTYREGGKRITSSAFVYCNFNDCGAHGPQKDTVEEAWEAWDRRMPRNEK